MANGTIGALRRSVTGDADEIAFIQDRPTAVCSRPRDAFNIVYVINGDAGAVRRLGPLALRSLIARASEGRATRIVTTDRHDFRATLLDVGRERPSAIAVIGGDGTARTALETLASLNIPVAPLPGGTLNRIASRVYGAASLPACIGLLGQGAPQPISGAIVGSHRFFVAAGFGAWMQVQAVRERFRGAKLNAARAMMELASRQFSCRVSWAPNGSAPLEHSTLVVGVGRIDSALGLGSRRHHPSVLEAAGADVRTLADLGVVLAASAARRWRHLRQVTTVSCRTIAVDAAGGRISALLDGEHHLMSSPVEIRFDSSCGLVWSPPARRRSW